MHMHSELANKHFFSKFHRDLISVKSDSLNQIIPVKKVKIWHK
jgi:hypothetical protein